MPYVNFVMHQCWAITVLVKGFENPGKGESPEIVCKQASRNPEYKQPGPPMQFVLVARQKSQNGQYRYYCYAYRFK